MTEQERKLVNEFLASIPAQVGADDQNKALRMIERAASGGEAPMMPNGKRPSNEVWVAIAEALRKRWDR